MPSELDDLYHETLERIQKQAGEDGQLGMRVLSWITHTRMRLSVEEVSVIFQDRTLLASPSIHCSRYCG